MSMKTKQLGRMHLGRLLMSKLFLRFICGFLHEKRRLFGELSEQNRKVVHDQQCKLEQIDW